MYTNLTSKEHTKKEN